MKTIKSAKVRESLPQPGQVTRVGSHVFEVRGYQPSLSLFHICEGGTGYSADIPLAQRFVMSHYFVEGTEVGRPFPTSHFFDLRWFKSVDALSRWKGAGQ